MKKITIGRNNACDIVIPDTTDLVSRKQAILSFSFWGKMVLYDTSNNGTYVNGEKIESIIGVSVTRKDKVNFAHVADLNWDEVKDPYRRIKIIYVLCALAIMIITLLLVLWPSPSVTNESDAPMEIEITEDKKGETVTSVKPKVEEELPNEQKNQTITPQKSKKANRTNPKKGHQNVSKEQTNNDVIDKSPIVY